MNNLVVILLVLIILGAFGGFHFGGPYWGSGLGGVLILILLILLLTGRL